MILIYFHLKSSFGFEFSHLLEERLQSKPVPLDLTLAQDKPNHVALFIIIIIVIVIIIVIFVPFCCYKKIPECRYFIPKRDLVLLHL